MEIQSPQLNKMSTVSESGNSNTTRNLDKKPQTAAEIENWLVSYLAELQEIAPNEVDVATPFDQYGLDSVGAVSMTGDLENWLEKEIDPTLIYDYPNIESVAQHLGE